MELNLIESLINENLIYDSKNLSPFQAANFSYISDKAQNEKLKKEVVFSKQTSRIEGKYDQLLRVFKTKCKFLYIILLSS